MLFVLLGLKFFCFRFPALQIFSFTAAELHIITLVPFMLSFTEYVIIQGGNTLDQMGRILQESPRVGLHTGIVHITLSTTVWFLWAESNIRPWGFHLPAQCPSCRGVWTWSRSKNIDKNYMKVCEALLPNGRRCGHKLEFKAPVGYETSTRVSIGEWLYKR